MSREPRPAALVTDTVIEDTAVSLMTHLKGALKIRSRNYRHPDSQESFS
jgi:hypothetical protein